MKEIIETRKVLASLEEARAAFEWWTDEWWALATRSKFARNFIADGGCTLTDLGEFMETGEVARGCHAKRRHLRLVSMHPRRRVRLSRPGPDAA